MAKPKKQGMAMGGVPSSVGVKMPKPMHQTGGGMKVAQTPNQGSGNPMSKIKGRSQGKNGGTSC